MIECEVDSLNPESPGEWILKELRRREWTQKDLAWIVDRPDQWVSQIVNNRKEMTVRAAMEVGAAFAIAPGFLLSLQHHYRIWATRSDGLDAKLADVRRRSFKKRKPDLGYPRYWLNPKRVTEIAVEPSQGLFVIVGGMAQRTTPEHVKGWTELVKRTH